LRPPGFPGLEKTLCVDRLVRETKERRGNSQISMNSKTIIKITCKNCGAELSTDHSGPCPKCGKVGKHIHAEVKETIAISEKGYMKSTKEYIKKNLKDILLMKLIVIIGLILGFFISGIIGAIIGIIIAIASDLLAFKPVEKIKEIHHRSF